MVKEFAKKIVPAWLLQWYRNRHGIRFRNKSAQEVFTEIYKSNYWQSAESISGPGSEIAQTTSLIRDLSKLLEHLNITSVLDLPCGDFKWMQKVDLSGVNYVGADIVKELIESNRRGYRERKNLEFQVLNLTTDPLPKSDMIIVRDCLVHLSYDDINRAIKNIKASESRYLLTTTFTNHHMNRDIVTGDWRPLNLQEGPFDFSPPLLVINENCTENNGEFKDKSMALWEISDI